jgi:hypothetical protein
MGLPAPSQGHWFCDHCDDIVFMSYERTDQTNVPCPRCGRLACNFIPRKLDRKTLPKDWFNAMRELVAANATPELPDMRHHTHMRK